MVPTERLHASLMALSAMIEEDAPVRESSRFLKTVEVFYVFADASERILGSGMERSFHKDRDMERNRRREGVKLARFY